MIAALINLFFLAEFYALLHAYWLDQFDLKIFLQVGSMAFSVFFLFFFILTFPIRFLEKASFADFIFKGLSLVFVFIFGVDWTFRLFYQTSWENYAWELLTHGELFQTRWQFLQRENWESFTQSAFIIATLFVLVLAFLQYLFFLFLPPLKHFRKSVAIPLFIALNALISFVLLWNNTSPNVAYSIPFYRQFNKILGVEIIKSNLFIAQGLNAQGKFPNFKSAPDVSFPGAGVRLLGTSLGTSLGASLGAPAVPPVLHLIVLEDVSKAYFTAEYFPQLSSGYLDNPQHCSSVHRVVANSLNTHEGVLSILSGEQDPAQESGQQEFILAKKSESLKTLSMKASLSPFWRELMQDKGFEITLHTFNQAKYPGDRYAHEFEIYTPAPAGSWNAYYNSLLTMDGDLTNFLNKAAQQSDGYFIIVGLQGPMHYEDGFLKQKTSSRILEVPLVLCRLGAGENPFQGPLLRGTYQPHLVAQLFQTFLTPGLDQGKVYQNLQRTHLLTHLTEGQSYSQDDLQSLGALYSYRNKAGTHREWYQKIGSSSSLEWIKTLRVKDHGEVNYKF